jgi:hypothetical protein
MNDNDLNIVKYIKALEGNHDLYPKGINKKINIKKLSDNQKKVIEYHYNSTFGEGDWNPPSLRRICE